MIDLTPIFIGVISLVSVVLTTILIPYIKRKVDANKLGEISYWVITAVNAVEQLAKSGIIPKEKKKEEVLKFLNEHGYTIDADKIDMLIEEAVYKMNCNGQYTPVTLCATAEPNISDEQGMEFINNMLKDLGLNTEEPDSKNED